MLESGHRPCLTERAREEIREEEKKEKKGERKKFECEALPSVD